MAPRDTLSVGKKLVIWTNAEIAASLTSPRQALGNTTRKLRYVVRNGDSLYLIANKFRVTIGDLLRWNKIDKNKVLRPGQKITVFADVTAQSS
jgi:membrane-bound lytic murein transglycosylase D